MLKSFTCALPKLLQSSTIRFTSGLTLSLAVVSCAPTSTPTVTSPSPNASTPTATTVATPTQTIILRIGHQKFDPLTLVKNKGGLEKRLKPLGVTEIKWTEFPSGPPMLEALSV
ncbi:MAG: hypothetical protein ACK47G_19440, partial [Pseudanabaena sp.]